MASCIVRWRGSLPLRIAFSTPKRWSRRWAISATPIARARAAASSIASGIPSSRRQISTTSGAVAVVEHEGGVGGLGPSDEERDRGDLGQFAEHQIGAEQLLGPGRQRVHRPEPLAGHRQRFPAGGDDRDGGCLAQDPRHQLGHGLDQVLAVVEHQQAVPGAQQIDDGIVDRARLPQVDVDGRGERRGRGVLVDDADQLHDVDAVLELGRRRCGPAPSRARSSRRLRGRPA